MNTPQVVTRFAPSPTGKAHAGSYRTALYAWLFARRHGGRFILRIEDTDTARNSKEAERDIYEALAWLGIDYDERYIQSEHQSRHTAVLQELINSGKAYISPEPAKDGSGVVKDIVRFRNPNKIVSFTDEIRDTVSTDTSDLGDFVIARSLTEPLYHLAVIIDDHDEGVTHVIRAEEHIANTPRQILLIEALGWDMPRYAHIPIVLGADKQKLSKRKGALAMTEYAKQGYLKEAVFNAIAMIGWNPADPGSDQELFSTDELVARFDLTRVQKGAAVFNVEKLNWFNREYITLLTSAQFWSYAEAFVPGEILAHTESVVMLRTLEQLIRDRINTFGDIATLFEQGEFSYFFEAPTIDPNIFVWKTLRDDPEGVAKTKAFLTEAVVLLEMIPESSWDYDTIKMSLADLCTREGNGAILWPMRVALSGREKSPDPFEVAALLGKTLTISRILAA